MSNSCDIRSITPDLVLYDAYESGEAHKVLFELPDKKYRLHRGKLIENLISFSEEGVSKIDLSLLWENIIRLSSWKDFPDINDLIQALQSAGAEGRDIETISNMSPAGHFLYFYDSRKHDILRRLCSYAKRRAEFELYESGLSITCHLVTVNEGIIVASSL